MTHEHDSGFDNNGAFDHYEVSASEEEFHNRRRDTQPGCMRYVLLIVVVIVGVNLLEAGNPVLLCVALTLGALIWGLWRDMD